MMVFSRRIERCRRLVDGVLIAIDYGLDSFDPVSRVLPKVAYDASTLHADGTLQVRSRFRVSAYGREVDVFYNFADNIDNGKWDERLLRFFAKDNNTARGCRDKLVTALGAV